MFRHIVLIGLLTSLPLFAVSPAARELDESFAQVYEKVSPSVVVIDVRGQARPAPGHNGSEEGPRGTGSGVIISADGYIVTNQHVVQSGEHGRITVRLQDGRKFPARYIGCDERVDIAVVKIDADGLPACEFADSDAIRVGQFAFAIGAPYDLPYTFTKGVVSAKGRTGLTEGAYQEFLQTDAAINPGNSGGPLCNLDGQVIGINTMIRGINRGLGFAVPSNIARDVATQLIKSGRVVRPYFGLMLETLAESRYKAIFPTLESGVLVTYVAEGSPAQQSGLRVGDVVLKVDGKKVTTTTELQREILSKAVGQNVEIELWRQEKVDGPGKALTLKLVTGEQLNRTAAMQQRTQQRRPSPETAVPVLPADSPAASLGLALEETPQGQVRIVGVGRGSPAAVARLRAGDIILEVARQPVRTIADLEILLEQFGEDRGIMLTVERDGETTYGILKK